MDTQKICRFCNKTFSRKSSRLLHEKTCDKNILKSPIESQILQTGAGEALDHGFQLYKSSLGGVVRDYKLQFMHRISIDWFADLNEAVTQDAYQLLQNLQHREGKLFKWYLTLEVTFRQAKNPNIITDPPAYFNTRPHEHYLGNTVEVLKNKMKVLVEKIDSYEQSGSGWIVDNFISLIVAISKIPNPLSSKKEEKSNDDDHVNNYEKEITL